MWSSSRYVAVWPTIAGHRISKQNQRIVFRNFPPAPVAAFSDARYTAIWAGVSFESQVPRFASAELRHRVGWKRNFGGSPISATWSVDGSTALTRLAMLAAVSL